MKGGNNPFAPVAHICSKNPDIKEHVIVFYPRIREWRREHATSGISEAIFYCSFCGTDLRKEDV